MCSNKFDNCQGGRACSKFRCNQVRGGAYSLGVRPSGRRIQAERGRGRALALLHSNPGASLPTLAQSRHAHSLCISSVLPCSSIPRHFKQQGVLVLRNPVHCGHAETGPFNAHLEYAVVDVGGSGVPALWRGAGACHGGEVH